MSKRKEATKNGNHVIRPEYEADRAEAVLITDIDEDDDPSVPAATVLRFYRTADEALSSCKESEHMPQLVDLHTPSGLLRRLAAPAAPFLLCLDNGYVMVETLAHLSEGDAMKMAKSLSARWAANAT